VGVGIKNKREKFRSIWDGFFLKRCKSNSQDFFFLIKLWIRKGWASDSLGKFVFKKKVEKFTSIWGGIFGKRFKSNSIDFFFAQKILDEKFTSIWNRIFQKLLKLNFKNILELFFLGRCWGWGAGIDWKFHKYFGRNF